jgi:hypothetical protein
LQAMLFFDEVWCVDDFEDDARRQHIADLEYINFLSKGDVEYGSLWATAYDVAQNTALRIVDGKIDASAFKIILQQVKAHLNFDFIVHASSVHLTARLFAETAGLPWKSMETLWELIAQQMRGEPRSPDPRYTSPFTEEDERSLRDALWCDRRHLFLDKSVVTIATSLNWLAMKTVFYVKVGERHDMDVILHPIRHAFLAHHVQTEYHVASSTYDSVMAMLQKGISGAIHEITRASEPVLSELRLPMWAAYLATKTSNPSEFITLCQHLRQERLFVEARRRLAELRELIRGNELGKYVTEMSLLNRSLADVAARLLAKYGVNTPQGIAVAPIVNIGLRSVGHPVPAGLTRVPIPRALIGSTDTHGFRGVFRSIINDLVSIERLGGLHDVIRSKVRMKGKHVN